jgi:sigma-B regulation protein RsbU (phosphoserine phosphatase)
MSTVINDGVDLAYSNDPAPAKIPRIRDGHIAAVYYGQRRSGDYYDFVHVNRSRLLFGIFDVAGSLPETRTVMLPLQETFRSVGTRLFESTEINELHHIQELWIQMNKAVIEAARGVHSCPALFGCYNEEARTFSYVNAGHTPGLWRVGQELLLLKATALPLGLFSHSIPESSMIALGPADAVLLVSKGIIEAKCRGEEFGIERTKEYFRQSGLQSAHETCVGILARVRQFMGTAPTHNDVTALCLVRSMQSS